MSECSHNCSSCNQKCNHPESLLEAPHILSDIKHVIAIVSGKGGVGKSLITGLLTSSMNAQGKRCGVIDADVTGPSIPQMFGINQRLEGSETDIIPAESKKGVKVVSVNLMLQDIKEPVIWRGPIVAGIVGRFWKETVWGNLDYLFIDCPPGTSDVPLTVFQTIKIDGVIIVTSPQDLVSMIVGKAVNMAKKMNIPILGLIENMSYLHCPDCGKEIHIYGESKVNKVAIEYGLDVLGRIPIDPSFAEACDNGKIEDVEIDFLAAAEKKLLELE